MTTISTDNTPDSSDRDFEAGLQNLLFESFAQGATIQGVWKVSSESSVVPSWRVTIEKMDEATPPEENPAFIDE